MTFVFGRKKLVISFTSEQFEKTVDRYPMAYAATDHELERLNRLGPDAVSRIDLDRDVHRIMNGAGWVR